MRARHSPAQRAAEAACGEGFTPFQGAAYRSPEGVGGGEAGQGSGFCPPQRLCRKGSPTQARAKDADEAQRSHRHQGRIAGLGKAGGGVREGRLGGGRGGKGALPRSLALQGGATAPQKPKGR